MWYIKNYDTGYKSFLLLMPLICQLLIVQKIALVPGTCQCCQQRQVGHYQMDMAWNVSSVEGLRIQFAHGSLPVIVAMELFISQVTLVLFKIISS